MARHVQDFSQLGIAGFHIGALALALFQEFLDRRIILDRLIDQRVAARR